MLFHETLKARIFIENSGYRVCGANTKYESETLQDLFPAQRKSQLGVGESRCRRVCRPVSEYLSYKISREYISKMVVWVVPSVIIEKAI